MTINDHTISISIPGKQLKRDTEKQIQAKKEKFGRRAAIEPVIGHLKSDHRMERNYLKGFLGDQINLLLAATAFNLKKWMRIYFYALFSANFKLLQETSMQIERYCKQFIMILEIKIYLDLFEKKY